MDNPGEKRRAAAAGSSGSSIVVVVALFALRFWKLSGKESYASISSIQETEGKPVEVVAAARRGISSRGRPSRGRSRAHFQYPVDLDELDRGRRAWRRRKGTG